ncbi:MFS transporter [Actinomadura rudentiformis]|uniref:MFS transporter n=1 Tax=Actinomadura rudentiformis TaxID=359158 RepID=UPI00178C787D|nr:MFS transporter [Actinomadura rudentiformis]
MTRRLAGAVSLFRGNPVWVRYFLGRWISVTGSTVAPIALAFAVLDLGGGPTGLGLVLVSGPVTHIVVSPFAGVVADRFARHLVLACCQVVNGTVQAVTALLVLTGAATVPVLAGLGLVTGAATSAIRPAGQGLLPQLVERDRLPDANALTQISNNLAGIGGPALAGVLVAGIGPGWVLAWDAASFFLSAALLFTLPVGRVKRGLQTGMLAELREGWAVFLSLRWVGVLALLSATSSALWAAGITVLGPAYANDHLGGPAAWGVLNSALAAGFAVGSITALLVRPRRAGLICCLAMLPEAALLGCLAAQLPLPAIAVTAAVCGVGGTFELVTYTSTLQARLPEEQMSRVLATIALVTSLLVPVALVSAGPLAAAAGATTVLAAAAVTALLAAALAFSIRDVRNLGKDDGSEGGVNEV